MKILTIIGARPQFIKASSLSREFGKRDDCEEVIVHTGQHFDDNMSRIFFEEMQIPEPKYHLEINSLSHGAMTGRMLEEIEKALLAEKPDIVVVYGDTNSTLAGALAAKKLHIKVAHIEAGLRSFDMKMPEEVNRILTDRISDILFCPTSTAIENLEREGYANNDIRIVMSGDIMYDSAMHFKKIAKPPTDYQTEEPFILVTVHRQENTDDKSKLRNVLRALNDISEKGHHIVWPMHPRTKKVIEDFGWEINFTPLPPVGYLEMLYLLDNCQIVITDSGGLQKEAYFFEKYCVTLRDSTEWIELVENNVNSLVDVSLQGLTDELTKHLNKKINNSSNLYGNGNTSSIIADELLKKPTQ